jgi:hypothetical protein
MWSENTIGLNPSGLELLLLKRLFTHTHTNEFVFHHASFIFITIIYIICICFHRGQKLHFPFLI